MGPPFVKRYRRRPPGPNRDSRIRKQRTRFPERQALVLLKERHRGSLASLREFRIPKPRLPIPRHS